jgi:hypothetical protein
MSPELISEKVTPLGSINEQLSFALLADIISFEKRSTMP